MRAAGRSALAVRSGRIALAIGSVLLALVVAEAVLRLALHGSALPLAARSTAGRIRDPHPVLGWVGRPNVDVWRRQLDYLVRIETNSRGFRDVEHALAKPAGVRRVVVLGDSFMEATQTPLESSFPRRLEDALGPGHEVINLGVSGYGTLQELLLLQEIGLAYRPDVVLLAFFNGNDVRDGSRELEHRLWRSPGPLVASRPYATIDEETGALAITPPDVRPVAAAAAQPEGAPSFDPLRHALVGRLAALGAQRVRDAWRAWWNGRPAGPDPNFALGWPVLAAPLETGRSRAPSAAEIERLWEDAWRTTARLILEVRDVAERSGARFLLVSIPSRLQVEPSLRASVQRSWPDLRFDETRINRALAELAAAHGLAFVDLLPAFTAGREDEPLYHTFEDEHWNAAGHRLAAEVVAAAILDPRGSFPRPPAPGAAAVADPRDTSFAPAAPGDAAATDPRDASASPAPGDAAVADPRDTSFAPAASDAGIPPAPVSAAGSERYPRRRNGKRGNDEARALSPQHGTRVDARDRARVRARRRGGRDR